MSGKGLSLYATKVPDKKKDRPRVGPAFGLCVHTSGRGVTKRATALGKHPDDVAIDYYDDAKYSAHYAVGMKAFYQITDDLERVQHVGFAGDGIGGKMTGAQRRQWYLSGKWANDMPAAFVKRWRDRWPMYKSPAHLYPSAYPNDDYIAVEMIPCLGFAEPLREGLWYTLAQHAAVGLLAADLAERHGWPLGWEHTPRLATHEDLGPHARVNGAGAWDPGLLRASPWIDWPTVLAWVNIARFHGVAETAQTIKALYL